MLGQESQKVLDHELTSCLSSWTCWMLRYCMQDCTKTISVGLLLLLLVGAAWQHILMVIQKWWNDILMKLLIKALLSWPSSHHVHIFIRESWGLGDKDAYKTCTCLKQMVSWLVTCGKNFVNLIIMWNCCKQFHIHLRGSISKEQQKIFSSKGLETFWGGFPFKTMSAVSCCHQRV